jgi:hypothetical protein
VPPNTSRWQSVPGGLDALHARELFDGDDVFGIPSLLARPVDVTSVPRWLAWSERGRRSDGSGLHFFVDDYRFETVWRTPYRYVDVLGHAPVAGFDFSTFTDWPIALQVWNTYRNRWLCRWFQERGIAVVPTIGWGDFRSYAFAFAGVPRGVSVAISTTGCLKAQWFEAGYREMVRRIEPATVLVFGPRLPERLEELARVHYGTQEHLERVRGDRGERRQGELRLASEEA